MKGETRRRAEIEMDRLKSEMDALHSIIWHNGRKISFKGFLSMLDAAMLNYYTRNKSHWRCVFCWLLPREVRLIRFRNFPLNYKALDTLCISILHFPLRMGDHLLKIAYSKSFKCGRVQGDRNKRLFKIMKSWVQLRFRKDKDILMDMPLSKGGTSTCGNLWR